MHNFRGMSLFSLKANANPPNAIAWTKSPAPAFTAFAKPSGE
jgi:hypothetical protein